MLGACNVPAAPGSRIELCPSDAESLAPVTSSRVTSLSQVRLNSSEARRNSARFLPSERLICGSLRGPKKTSAITKMKTSSVLPSDSRINKTTFAKYLSACSLWNSLFAVGDCNPWVDKPEGSKSTNSFFATESCLRAYQICCLTPGFALPQPLTHDRDLKGMNNTAVV